jgi:hypothetical protein
MFDHHTHFPDGRQKSVYFSELWAPWLSTQERDDLIGLSQRFPRRWSAVDLGGELNLTREDREELGVTTIRAVDQTDDELREQRNARKRDRQAAKRRLAKLTQKAPAVSHRTPKCRTERQLSLIKAGAEALTWLTMPNLIAAVGHERCWCGTNGRTFERETLRRLINRELGPLIDDGTFEGAMADTKWRQEARQVRLRISDHTSAVTNDLVPASRAGTPGQKFHEN